MKIALVLASLAAAVVAQETTLVKCAEPCVNKFTVGQQVAGCKQGDFGCVCANSDFLDQTACCLQEVCTPEEQRKAVDYAQNICVGAGVQVPSEVVCKTASASPSASGSPTASGSGAPSGSGSPTGQGAPPSTSTPNAGPTQAPAVGSFLGGVVAALAML